MVSGEQDSTNSVILSDWVRDVNRSMLRKLEDDLRNASAEDPKNDLLIRSMKEISILKSEINRLEMDLRECSQHLDECMQTIESAKRSPKRKK